MQPQMAYDRAITVFSPDGRLFQVEYAREAVKRGTTTVALKFVDGVALIVDKRVVSRLVEPDSIEKIFCIDTHIGCATSGLVADARALVDRARMDAQINNITYEEKIHVKTLVKKICDFKQSYTQFGGVRPFGTSLLIGGVDDLGCHLFATDPSGAMIGYKATAEGAGRTSAMEFFEKEYKDNLSMDEAILLGIKALYVSTDKKLEAKAVEIGVVNKDKKFRKLTVDEAKGYVKKVIKK